MPIELDHQNIRDLAKKLRELTGRDVKHTEIISAIAASVGRKADALMHELKNAHPKPGIAMPPGHDTPEAAMRWAKDCGFEAWDTGGGCMAFGKSLRKVDLPSGDVAALDVLITVDGGVSIDAGPYEKVWSAGVNYQDPRGADTVAGADEAAFTLSEALAIAMLFEQDVDRLWSENYDADAIEAFENGRSVRA